jgi:phosphoribosyl 1,2-cyclic phosphodiesterase
VVAEAASGLRFALLGSGSRGNATLVCHGSTRVLVDCGFSATEAQRRLARLGVDAAELDAIIVTHEHSDHIGGVARLARRYDIPVWMTPGTHEACREMTDVDVVLFDPHTAFAIGDFEVTPYPVPHDAREPCQLVFGDGDLRLGVLSDAGHVTPYMRTVLAGCHGLLLEANHDVEMMIAGPYPPSLKARVMGDRGHLSNLQSADLLRSIDTGALRHLVLTHLSETNNRPELALQAASEALNCTPDWLCVADQNAGLGWRTL